MRNTGPACCAMDAGGAVSALTTPMTRSVAIRPNFALAVRDRATHDRGTAFSPVSPPARHTSFGYLRAFRGVVGRARTARSHIMASNARAHRPGLALLAQVRCSALFGDSLWPPIRSQFCPNKPYRLFLVEEVPVVEKPAAGGFNQGFVYGAWTPNQPAVFTPQTVCG